VKVRLSFTRGMGEGRQSSYWKPTPCHRQGHPQSQEEEAIVTSSERPIGQRFSHVYLTRHDLLQDSERARRRVAATLTARKDKDIEGLYGTLPHELGIDPVWGMSGVLWPETIKRFEARDFLDFITITFRFLTAKKAGSMYEPDANVRWLNGCRRIFAEESLSYDIDDHGGVHFKVDAEFAASSRASIAALGLPRYANARAEFEKAMNALSGSNVDGKEGIRGVFNAVECIYKLMNSKASKLTSADAIKNLQGEAQKVYGTNPTALRAANKAINAFGDWVDACHNYRHEEGVEEPSQPPIDLAVELISVGASHLRWLISLDLTPRSV